jgi:prevent-host-death family protein
MERVTIRELHLRTGEWVRRTRTHGKVIVTDRGRPVATIAPYDPTEPESSFAQRLLLPEFASLPPMEGDVTSLVSQDRDRE